MRREICSPNMANGKKNPRQALLHKACRGLIRLLFPHGKFRYSRVHLR